MRTPFNGLALIAASMLVIARSHSQPEQANKHRSPIPQVGGAGLLEQGVRRRVPQDYLTIQAAIDASSDGDTVLVSEGTYFENIRYRGKAILVGSMYVVDGDTTHIEKTIINGNRSTQSDSGSVVYFVDGEDTTSVLCGVTITGGTGTNYLYDSPFGTNWFRSGGGVFCNKAGARITRNTIARNRIVAPYALGGGLGAWGTPSAFVPIVILVANRISDNYLEADNNSGWWGEGGGAGLVGIEPQTYGNVFERDTVTGKSVVAGGGMQFDGFNALGPWPKGSIVGNVFRSNVLMTSQRVAQGGGLGILFTGEVRVEDNLFEGNLVESSASSAFGGGLEIADGSGVYGRKEVIHNQFIANHVQGLGWSTGGGIDIYGVQATLCANNIVENTVTGSTSCGGGIMVDSSAIRIENNIVRGNSSNYHGGGIEIIDPPLHGTGQVIVNNTIYGNASGQGSGLAVGYQASVVVFNNIFWANSAPVGAPIIYIHDKAMANVSYCNVEFGYVGEGNVYLDPMFVDGDSLFHLQLNSPCIGVGRASIQMGQVCYYASASDFDGRVRPMPPGTHVDMGAQEEQITVGVGMKAVDLPTHFTLGQNFPNPFNPTTVVSFQLPVVSDVRLVVYDVLGREVAVLANERKAPGMYQVEFRAGGTASGIYLCRLTARRVDNGTAELFEQTRRMVLLR